MQVLDVSVIYLFLINRVRKKKCKKEKRRRGVVRQKKREERGKHEVVGERTRISQPALGNRQSL